MQTTAGVVDSMVAGVTHESAGLPASARGSTRRRSRVERLQLLHRVATSANGASSLETLAPALLELVCATFDWPAAALLAWRGPGVSDGPELLAHWGGSDRLPVGPGRVWTSEPVTLAGGAVLVPLTVPPTVTGADRFAWWFDTGTCRLGDDEREVLDLLSQESSRVLEREEVARLLRSSEERFRSLFDLSPVPMGLTVGYTGTYTAVNEAMCQLLGRSHDDLVGMSARELVHPEDTGLVEAAGAAALAAVDGRHQLEMRFLHVTGAVVDGLVTLAWMTGADGTPHLLAHVEDITQRRSFQEAMRRQAEEDSLTGLVNRPHLIRVLDQLGLMQARCEVLFVDLDGFKQINDTRGHVVGDEVLVEVARRLQAAFRPTDVVARFGADEFVVVCPVTAQEEPRPLTAVAERVRAVVAQPILTRAGAAELTSSIGLASGLVDPTQPQELVNRADTAMHQAKRRGKDCSETYDELLHARTTQHQRTVSALRHALDDERFVVHYQPIVDLADSSVVGFEALVRLLDEDGRLVPPDQFIGVAEQSGLIVPMGAWVLQESCRTIAGLRALTGRDLTVSVNLAAQQAARPDLVSTVEVALRETGLPTSALSLELTESALLEAGASTLRQLVGLQERGVSIALDDFGTGYSSLTYLRQLPVSHLKVDRSFVQGMLASRSDLAIVRAVTGLADDLGLGWVAEGIETVGQLDAVAALGRGFGQGYLFGRPTSAKQLPALLG